MGTLNQLYTKGSNGTVHRTDSHVLEVEMEENQRQEEKQKIPLTTMKNTSNIIAESVALQREERQSDQFGNKSFLLSFLPLMESLPSDLAIEARYKVAEVFRNISAARRASSSVISPASAFVTSSFSVLMDVSDASEDNLASWNFICYNFTDFESTNVIIMHKRKEAL
jgi:hypothetical protein